MKKLIGREYMCCSDSPRNGTAMLIPSQILALSSGSSCNAVLTKAKSTKTAGVTGTLSEILSQDTGTQGEAFLVTIITINGKIEYLSLHGGLSWANKFDSWTFTPVKETRGPTGASPAEDHEDN